MTNRKELIRIANIEKTGEWCLDGGTIALTIYLATLLRTVKTAEDKGHRLETYRLTFQSFIRSEKPNESNRKDNLREMVCAVYGNANRALHTHFEKLSPLPVSSNVLSHFKKSDITAKLIWQ